MANNHSDLTSLFTDIADAIRSKTGGSDPIVADQFPEAIEGISGGGADDGWPVNFPVGDGNTHIWIDLPEGRTSPMLGLGVNGTVTVDWGDGTAHDTLTGTDDYSMAKTPNHNYASAGKYIITLIVDGTARMLPVSSYAGLLSAAGIAKEPWQIYRNAISKVEFGNNVLLGAGGNGLASCAGLTDVVLSADAANSGKNNFSYCSALEEISLPIGTTLIVEGCFRHCGRLRSVSIPDGVTMVGTGAFYSCANLTRIVFPESLEAISINGFYGCNGMAYYDFTKLKAVPSLGATNAFQGVLSDCVFLVPAALAEEWKAATNWSTYADKIVGV